MGVWSRLGHHAAAIVAVYALVLQVLGTAVPATPGADPFGLSALCQAASGTPADDGHPSGHGLDCRIHCAASTGGLPPQPLASPVPVALAALDTGDLRTFDWRLPRRPKPPAAATRAPPHRS